MVYTSATTTSPFRIHVPTITSHVTTGNGVPRLASHRDTRP
jgi:hypothetical protein